MNQSKTGLNDSFYKWVDDVRRAMRKMFEYEEKLEFYNVKLIGYKSISFDHILSTISNVGSDESILYWLDKINDTEKKLKEAAELFDKYDKFCLSINFSEAELLNYMVGDCNINDSPIPYGRRKQLMPGIIRKWHKYK